MKLAPASFEFRELRIDDIPPFNQDEESKPGPEVQRLKRDIAAANGLLFVTPEYNRSLPGVLKNAIDQASRPYGQNAWAGKPAGILSASIGSIGGAIAQQHLRTILAYLDVPTLGQPEAFIHVREDFFDASGAIAKPDSLKFLTSWMDRYVAWLGKFSHNRH
jgi:chromate reductase